MSQILGSISELWIASLPMWPTCSLWAAYGRPWKTLIYLKITSRLSERLSDDALAKLAVTVFGTLAVKHIFGITATLDYAGIETVGRVLAENGYNGEELAVITKTISNLGATGIENVRKVAPCAMGTLTKLLYNGHDVIVLWNAVTAIDNSGRSVSFPRRGVFQENLLATVVNIMKNQQDVELIKIAFCTVRVSKRYEDDRRSGVFRSFGRCAVARKWTD